MPYRGQPLPLREEEYDEISRVVYDAEVELFDISLAEDKARLRDVLDRASNGWYQILRYSEKWCRGSNGQDTVKVLLIWRVPYREVDASSSLKSSLQPVSLP